ncbi:MAG: hypothetical protein U0905_13820 [Pirellulales bacterium]
MKPETPSATSIPPRDAHQRGLHRIMTMGGEYGTRNYTIKHLQSLKGKVVLTETMPFTTNEAIAAEEAGIDTLKAKFDPKNPAPAIAIRKAAPNTFMTFCIGLTKIATVQEAVRAGFDAMEAGADAIMCQWNPEFIHAVSSVGIPVQAHAGLVPRLSTWTVDSRRSARPWKRPCGCTNKSSPSKQRVLGPSKWKSYLLNCSQRSHVALA